MKTEYSGAKRLVCALVLSILSVVSVQAQILYGSLVGTITDASEAAIPDATVTITNINTAAMASASPARRTSKSRSTQ